MSFEAEQPPKRSLGSKVKELLRKVLKKEEPPAVPEGAVPEKKSKKPHMEGAVQDLEDRVILQQDVEGLMKWLTPREREVYELVITEGRTNAEAARILGVTDEAIRQRRAAIVSKARLKFKK